MREKLFNALVITGGALSGALLVVVLVLAVQNTPARTPATREVTINRSTFIYVAQHNITGRLKAPSTAKFPPYSECGFVQTGESTAVVSGWVDAQNSFGAMLRYDWVVNVEQKGGYMYGEVVSFTPR